MHISKIYKDSTVMFVNRGHNSSTQFNSPFLLGAQGVLEVLVSLEDPVIYIFKKISCIRTFGLESNELIGIHYYYIMPNTLNFMATPLQIKRRFKKIWCGINFKIFKIK